MAKSKEEIKNLSQDNESLKEELNKLREKLNTHQRGKLPPRYLGIF